MVIDSERCVMQSGFTPLHIASHYGNISIGRFLIDKGADVNYKARVCRASAAADSDDYICTRCWSATKQIIVENYVKKNLSIPKKLQFSY